MLNTHDFIISKKTGDLGEEEFLRAFPAKLHRSDGIIGDLVTKDGRLVELKTEYYPLSTGNYFFEKLSSFETMAPGGPWSAAATGVSLYIHFFYLDRIAFSFDPKALATRLDCLIKSGQLVAREIYNKNHTTFGYITRRTLVSDLAKTFRVPK